jgi:hypothetical protein
MMPRAKIYKNNAVQCEREGDRATTPALKSKYRGVAQQWRDMAEEVKRETAWRPKKSGCRAAG